MGNIVAIVGRPNVGKSTLFNRLTESRDAIVDEQSGVTRDRHYGKTIWNGVEFSVIDTGGYVINSDDVFEEQIRVQVKLAIEEADVILFMVDVFSGITDMDEAVATLLRRTNKPTILVVNKVDQAEHQYDAPIFYRFGLGDLFTISANSGSGTGDLLDKVVESFVKENDEEEQTELPRFAVVGRPNVGKSSFINALIGEERTIVTPISGTTRDSIDTHFCKFGYDFTIVDTAGLRKRGKVKEDVEFYSTLRSVRTIENADVCFLLIDATLGVESQDMSIFNMIQRNHKGLVILVNKWDLVEEKDSNTTKEAIERIHERIAPFTDVPILFVSALSKQRIMKALEEGMRVYNNRTRKISTSELNRVMLEIIQNYPPPSYKGKYVKIKYVTQLPTYAPSFAFFCNLPQYVREAYKRYLENRMREEFDFTGVPIQLFMRKK